MAGKNADVESIETLEQTLLAKIEELNNKIILVEKKYEELYNLTAGHVGIYNNHIVQSHKNK